MKRIEILISILLIAMLLFPVFGYLNGVMFHNGENIKIVKNKSNTKRTEKFLSFTIDDPVMMDGKFQPIKLYSLDSVGWGKGYDIVSKTQRQLLDHPVLLMQPNETQTPFLVYPGDSIRIRYASTDTMQMYAPGKPVRSNELNFFRALVSRTGNLYYFFTPMRYHKKVNTLLQIQDLEKVIDSVKRNRMKFLAYYQEKFPLETCFTKVAINCIESTSIDDSLLLYHNNRDLLKAMNLYVQFAKAKIPRLEKIGFQPYPMFIQASKHALAMVTGTNPHDGGDMDSKIFPRRFDFIATSLTGDHRNFFLSSTMNLASKNNITISNAYKEKFNKLCTDKRYTALVHTILDDNKLKENFEKGGNKLLAIDGKTVQDMANAFQKYHGSLVLIDFWASWCAPCIQEIPYTAELKKKYNGKKLVFVTISTDDQVSAWRKSANAENLNGANDFLLLNSSTSSFVKQYGVQSIPRYMLLDKTGKMLNDDAPRPSSEKLVSLINKHL
ncbi:TlpA family protein disulfide reductase [Pedobacter sp. JCM 36344]|uniref:TlpA family protein disulfide reductase n=1 Tax=Pedobacter sp. JCM 36344 TaxID=3374280 RepID=UPI00397A8BD2